MSRVERIRIIVVFPAPLGPRTPKISPCSTSTLTPSSATTGELFVLNSLRSSSTSIEYLMSDFKHGIPWVFLSLPVPTSINSFVELLGNPLRPNLFGPGRMEGKAGYKGEALRFLKKARAGVGDVLEVKAGWGTVTGT